VPSNKPWLEESAPIQGDTSFGAPTPALTAEPVPAPQPQPAAPAKPWLSQSEPTAATPPVGEAAVKPKEGFLTRAKKAFTGEDRMDPDYANQPEFGDAYAKQTKADGWTDEGLSNIRKAIGLAQIAPTETGRINILKDHIPGLEVKKDRFGQYVAKAPGMTDFAYINKPGFSAQDVGEFGMQTVATLPFLGPAGAGSGLLTRIGLGSAGLGGASIAQDLLAAGVGSQEGIDPARAGVSAAIGGVLPVGEAGVRAGTQLAKSVFNRGRAVFDPKGTAKANVLGALEADRTYPRTDRPPLTDQEVATARGRGQDLRAMDLGGGESTLALARSAANQSPEARSALMSVIDERYQSQAPRTAEFLRSLTARPGSTNVSAYETKEQLQAAARAANAPLYDQARKDGAQGLMHPVLTQLQQAPAIQSAMRAAANSLKNRSAVGATTGARGPNGYTLEFWDQVKRRLDDKINTYKRSGAKSAALELDELRRPLVQTLDQLVPSYPKARGTAQTFFRGSDALEAGENFVNGRFEEAASRAALSKMNSAERELFAQGFASKLINEVRRTGDSRNILTKINNSADARSRLQLALGPNRARSIEGFLRVEGVMDLARTAMGNSTTARQLFELGLMGYGAYNMDPHSLLVAGLSWGDRRIQTRVAREVAQLLLSKDLSKVLQGIKQVGSTPMLNALRAFDKAIVSSGVGREAAKAITTPTEGAPAPQEAPEPGAAPSVPNPAPRAPAAATPASGGSSVAPKRSSALQGRDEAQRLAQEAISRGADPAAVQKRMQQYLQANGLA